MMNYKNLDRVFEFGYIEKWQGFFYGLSRTLSFP